MQLANNTTLNVGIYDAVPGGTLMATKTIATAGGTLHTWTMTEWSCSPGDWLVTGAWDDNDYNSVTPPLSDPDQRNALVFLEPSYNSNVVMEWS
jgi:hypothetical protein